MIWMRKHIAALLPVFTALAGVLSCSREPLQEEGTLKQVHLALSVSSFNTDTKADISRLTELDVDNPVFRGLVGVRVIPFDRAGKIETSDVARTGALAIAGVPHIASGTNAYLYASGIDAWLPTGTSSLLMYGRAPGDGTNALTRHRYGALLETERSTGGALPAASDFGFAPYVMVGNNADTPVEAAAIARTLNSIMLGSASSMIAVYDTDKEEVVRVNWNESTGDENLRQTYLQIINDGALIPGSGPMVEALLSSLYHMLATYESYNSNVYEVEVNGIPYEASKQDGTPLLYKDLYNRLRDVILSRLRNSSYLHLDPTDYSVTFVDEAIARYPETLGLPSGCAVLRWTPTGFVVPQLEGVEGMAPMTRYCFPPALYYYTNTTIKTSKEDSVREVYDVEQGYTLWSQILNNYTLGNSITSNTESVALVTPLHYAVGLMEATVKAEKNRLQDNDGLVETTVDASGQNLPVTGVVLGSQYAMNFDFTPVYTDDGEYFLYDDQISEVYLTTTKSAPIHTLSLQTPDDKDVYFCLELQNNTGTTFYGADGRVLPGRKFYMVGKLSMPPQPRSHNSVFVQDHLTTVDCTIHSLDGAYNAIPDLGLPQLVLGVQTKVNWKLATPTTVMLE